MMTNTQKRVATAFYYGARDFRDVYKSANDNKLAYWEKCRELAETLHGELRILTADRQGYTVGILYTDENCRACMAFVKDGKVYRFVVGDYVKFARRVYASNVNKKVNCAWRFN